MNSIRKGIIATVIGAFLVLFVWLYIFVISQIRTAEPTVEIFPKNEFDVTITVVADIEFDPFSFYDENGEPSGFDVELLYAIANDMHFNVDLKLMSWGAARAYIAEGRADIIMGNPYNQGGYANLIQSTALTNDPFVCIGYENYTRAADLDDKKLATIEKSGCVAEFLEPYKLLDNTRFYPSYTDAVLSVINGENDYALVRFSVANRILAKITDSDLGIVGPVLANSLLCFGVNDSNPDLAYRLDSSIRYLHHDGTIAALTEKWLGTYIETLSLTDLIKLYSLQIFIGVCVFFILISLFVFDISKSREKMKFAQRENELNKALLEAEEYAKLMLNAGPICCQLWSSSLKILDCNEAALNLYGYKDKQEYIEKWSLECSPEFQPDGSRSDEKGALMVKKAFMEGRCVFDWLHQMKDGTPIPAEITLVRIKYKNDYVVAGYTHDLREVKELEKEAQKIYYDALTGVYNRRYMEENFKHIMRLLSRSGGLFSLLMIDIDFFKQYNDTYGHDVGDSCLKDVAKALENSIARADDYIVRYGGEEFAAVLPHTDANGCRVIAERMLENVRNMHISHQKSEVSDYVTVSIGGVTGTVKHIDDGGIFIKRADEMLYDSKRGGRNRYTAATL